MRFQKCALILTLLAANAFPVFSKNNSSDNDQLIEILRQKQMELDAGGKPKATQMAPTEAGKKKKKNRKKQGQLVTKSTPKNAPSSDSKMKEGSTSNNSASLSDDELTQLLRQKQSELNGTSASRSASSSFIPSTLTGSKESRLSELLRRYKTDEITPHEYHEQRSKIIAEP